MADDESKLIQVIHKELIKFNKPEDIQMDAVLQVRDRKEVIISFFNVSEDEWPFLIGTLAYGGFGKRRPIIYKRNYYNNLSIREINQIIGGYPLPKGVYLMKEFRQVDPRCNERDKQFWSTYKNKLKKAGLMENGR